MTWCDVLVAGGGPAGAAAAIVLSRRGRRVVLADNGGRASYAGEALPPVARPLLRRLGVLDRVAADGHLTSHGNVVAWNSSRAEPTDFIFNAHGPGYHLDRTRFDAMLRTAAADAGTMLVDRARVDVRTDVVLQYGTSTERVDCRWVLDATGRFATVAARRGARRRMEDRLLAFLTRWHPSADRAADVDARTLVEAEANGWWYSALVPSGDRVVVLFTDPDTPSGRSLLLREGFATRVARTKHVSRVLATHGYQLVSRPRGVDASCARLDPVFGAGWIAAGDAALAFDPLSSQGIFNALYTGVEAGRAIDAALSGNHNAAGRYAAQLSVIHAAYRVNAAAFYGAERRWPTSRFWQHRRAAYAAT
jgi:flavin-dependent dehydrogenase